MEISQITITLLGYRVTHLQHKFFPLHTQDEGLTFLESHPLFTSPVLCGIETFFDFQSRANEDGVLWMVEPHIKLIENFSDLSL